MRCAIAHTPESRVRRNFYTLYPIDGNIETAGIGSCDTPMRTGAYERDRACTEDCFSRAVSISYSHMKD